MTPALDAFSRRVRPSLEARRAMWRALWNPTDGLLKPRLKESAAVEHPNPNDSGAARRHDGVIVPEHEEALPDKDRAAERSVSDGTNITGTSQPF